MESPRESYTQLLSLAVHEFRTPASVVGGYDTSGNAYGVAVSGSYAYVADDTAGLQVIDVSNRANPQPLIPFNATISALAAVPPSALVLPFHRRRTYNRVDIVFSAGMTLC